MLHAMTERTPDSDKQKPHSINTDDETWETLLQIAKRELNSNSRSQAIRYLAREYGKKRGAR